METRGGAVLNRLRRFVCRFEPPVVRGTWPSSGGGGVGRSSELDGTRREGAEDFGVGLALGVGGGGGRMLSQRRLFVGGKGSSLRRSELSSSSSGGGGGGLDMVVTGDLFCGERLGGGGGIGGAAFRIWTPVSAFGGPTPEGRRPTVGGFPSGGGGGGNSFLSVGVVTDEDDDELLRVCAGLVVGAAGFGGTTSWNSLSTPSRTCFFLISGF